MMEDTLDSLRSQMGHIFVAEDEEDDDDLNLENEDEETNEARIKKMKMKSGTMVLGCVEFEFTQRMVLGIGFLVAGLLLLGIAPLFIKVPTNFVWTYGFANIFVLVSCVFLIGPVRQLRVLVHDKMKVLAVGMYVCGMIAALIAALKVKMVVMTLFFVAFQLCSAFWYLGSYIPYVQTCISKTVGSVLPL